MKLNQKVLSLIVSGKEFDDNKTIIKFSKLKESERLAVDEIFTDLTGFSLTSIIEKDICELLEMEF